MSSNDDQGGAGRREVAYRLFASEFDDADFSYSESDEERAPNYVVTPTGARVNRLFIVGVLTEVETVSEDYLRARVVDPSGPFVVYAGQYQPEALAFLETAEPPAFVAVTGKARTYQPDDSDQVYTSVRPESINEVDAETRDRWVVQTAEQTLDRVARAAEAKQSGLSGDDLRAALVDHGVDESLAAGIPLALERYGTTGSYLSAVRSLALDAARVVAGEQDEVDPLGVLPDQGDDDALVSLVESPIDYTPPSDADEGPESELTEPDTDGETADDQRAGTAEPSTATSTASTDTAESSEPVADTQTESAATATETGQTETDSAGAEADAPAAETDASATESVADSVDKSGSDETVETTASTDDTDESTAASDDTAEASASDESTTATTDDPSATAPETASTAETAADPDAAATEADQQQSEPTATDDDADDLGDFDSEFDLDDDEREEIEAEYGTEFQSGTEVDDPGEADIDTPDPDGIEADTAEAADAESSSTSVEEDADRTETSDVSTTADETGATDDTTSSASETATDESDASGDDGAAPDEDVDLSDAVVDAMNELDDGDGADREAIVDTVVDRTGSDPDAVEDAIQEALMGGQCYEPDDGVLKPI